MKKKRGISPLIATVLILGFTVALAAIIMVWGQRFTLGMQQTTEEEANKQMKCATEVDFAIKDVCVATTGYKVVIENNAKTKITKLVVRFYEAADKMQANTEMFSANGVDPFEIGVETFDPTQLTDNSVKLVEAIPVITLGGKEVTCSANKRDFGSLDGPAITATTDACTP